MSDLFERHRQRLEAAVAASATRGHYAPYVESPSRKHHPEGAHAAGRAAFEARLGRPFALSQPGTVGRVGAEVSPYTGEPLGVDYPAADVEALFAGMRRVWPAWRDASPRARVGVCMEILDRLSRQVFENAYATMHTAGQTFMLGFAGSGASSLERGLEGIAYAWQAMSAIPERARFTRRFGRGAPVVLEKRYRLMPRGIAAVITCGSYPAWNAWPAILANLATGNPVVVKPHPASILPVAIAVETARGALADAGFEPDLLTLAADEASAPITRALLAHPDLAIVDFTGSQAFGAWIEEHCRRALVFTETSGCNAVILESAAELDAALAAIAGGLCLFSAQMCTAPQNLLIPRRGVRTPGGLVPFEEVVERLVARVDRIALDPERAAGMLGAICSPAVVEEEARLAAEAPEGGVLRASAPYAHPQFPAARTATPLILRADPADRERYGRERFGPVSYVIAADDRDHALALAARDARERGSIAAYAYTTDPAYAAQIEDAYALAGASVGINLVRHSPINFTAAFSDFHVTGLNPAGNACLTDLAFVAGRFRVVQSKTELPEEGP